MFSACAEQKYCQLDFFATYASSWLASLIEVKGILVSFRQEYELWLGLGLIVLTWMNSDSLQNFDEPTFLVTMRTAEEKATVETWQQKNSYPLPAGKHVVYLTLGKKWMTGINVNLYRVNFQIFSY